MSWLLPGAAMARLFAYAILAIDRPTIEEVIKEAEILLRLNSSSVARGENGARGVAHELERFLGTDAAIMRRESLARDEARNAADADALLSELHRAVHDQGSALLNQNSNSNPNRPQCRLNSSRGGTLPGEHTEIEQQLQMRPLVEARATTIVFSPGKLLKEEHGVPTISCVWSLIIVSGRKARFVSYVYTRDAPGHPKAFSKIDFDSSLDSPTLRRSMLGSVPRQLDAFLEQIRRHIPSSSV